MALHNPSSLYTGGNVVFDNTPYLRMAMQERTRKALRGQAIDQYYQKLPETINDKGVRDQEIPLIADIKNRMTETYLNNRDAIQKGDPAAVLKMNQLLREGLAITRGSQNASKIDIKLGSIATDPKNQSILNNDGFVQRHALHNLPVNDPNYKPLDLSQELADRPFDQQAYAKELKANMPYSQSIPTVTPHPTDKTLEIVTTSPVLSDETKQNLYATSAYKFHNDIAFQKQLQKDFSTPEQIAPLNEVSKRVFGHEIKEPEDLAAAYTASLLPTSSVRRSVRANIEDQRNFQDEQMQKRFRHQEQMANLNDRLIRKRKVDGVETGEVEVGYPTNEIDTEFGKNEPLQDSNGKDIGTRRVVYVDEMGAGTHRSINPKDINKGIYPIPPRTAKQLDGTWRDYYEVVTDANGNKRFLGAGGKKIDAEDARLNYIKEAVPNKQRLKIVSNKPGTTPDTGKTTMKNNSDYYNSESNVSKSEGNTVTYKDGTVWELKGNKMVQIK